MSSGAGTTAHTVIPIDWAWYRVYGSSAEAPPTIHAFNRRLARKAWLMGGAYAAGAAGVIAVLILLTVLGTLAPVLGVLLAQTVLVSLPACFTRFRSGAARARHGNVAAVARNGNDERIVGTPDRVKPPVPPSSPPASSPRLAQTTAALLEMLLAIPGTVVFHGLRLPGGTCADHAVAYGNVVFLLDSQLGRGGTYEWGPGGQDVIVRTDRADAPRPEGLHSAAEELRLLLGAEAEVIPMLMLHDAGTVAVHMSLSPHGVHLVTIGAAMERIGNTCAYGLAGPDPVPRVHEVLCGLVR